MGNLRFFASYLPSRWRKTARQRVARWKAARPQSVDRLMQQAFHNLRPLKVRPSTDVRYLTMVTDSVASAQLMGGVGTAVLLAVAIAREQNRRLRIVTREKACDEVALRALLDLQGMPHDDDIEMIFSDGTVSDPCVPLGDDDLILTTSWWGTWSTRQAVPAHQIVYLLQEDERMFYVGGDQHLLCHETLSHNDIRYVVNSQLLMQHFEETKTIGPANNGISFEPAFPDSIYYPNPQGGRKNLVFYARPDHPRNLFLRGVTALNKAFAEGLFAEEEWNIHFFGINIQQVSFPTRVIQYHDGLSWADYAALIRRADLGFSLMYTPHPSYPPLDLAASGAVVVTNAFGPKGTSAHYSENILYAPLDIQALVDGLRRGIARVDDDATRRASHAKVSLNRDWQTSFDPVLRWLASSSHSVDKS